VFEAVVPRVVRAVNCGSGRQVWWNVPSVVRAATCG
jgi:hypothetical protein